MCQSNEVRVADTLIIWSGVGNTPGTWRERTSAVVVIEGCLWADAWECQRVALQQYAKNYYMACLHVD